MLKNRPVVFFVAQIRYLWRSFRILKALRETKQTQFLQNINNCPICAEDLAPVVLFTRQRCGALGKAKTLEVKQ